MRTAVSTDRDCDPHEFPVSGTDLLRDAFYYHRLFEAALKGTIRS
jgi:hypothetical protein